MTRTPVIAMASGSGTLFQALIDATADPEYPAEIVALVSDRPDCQAMQRAAEAGIPAIGVPPEAFPSRADWDQGLLETVAALQPEWLISVGFMRILAAEFLDAFPGKVVNSHPSLLPSFTGAHAVADAVAHGVKVTGCTVHVVDHGVDSGPILAQEAVSIEADDDVDTLHERIKVVERRLVVDVLARLTRTGYSLDGRKATLL